MHHTQLSGFPSQRPRVSEQGKLCSCLFAWAWLEGQEQKEGEERLRLQKVKYFEPVKGEEKLLLLGLGYGLEQIVVVEEWGCTVVLGSFFDGWKGMKLSRRGVERLL